MSILILTELSRFDDYLFETEKDVLRNKNVFGSWIQIDLERNPQQLKKVYQSYI
jgi:hypothetical protein